jgi:hypothetical protein
MLIPYSEIELFSSVDDVFRGFCQGCVDNPVVCPLADNMMAGQLEEYLYGVLDRLRENPLPLSLPVPGGGAPGGGFLIDYSVLKTIILSSLNFPSQWPQLAGGLKEIANFVDGATPNITVLAGFAGMGGATDESQFGIKCGDVITQNTDLVELDPIFQARRDLSRFGDAADQVVARCAQWQLPAKKQFDGNLESVKTRNPVLFVNNRFDPVTPLASARNVSQTLAGSILLEQNSYGVRFPTNCSNEHLLVTAS